MDSAGGFKGVSEFSESEIKKWIHPITKRKSIATNPMAIHRWKLPDSDLRLSSKRRRLVERYGALMSSSWSVCELAKLHGVEVLEFLLMPSMRVRT